MARRRKTPLPGAQTPAPTNPQQPNSGPPSSTAQDAPSASTSVANQPQASSPTDNAQQSPPSVSITEQIQDLHVSGAGPSVAISQPPPRLVHSSVPLPEVSQPELYYASKKPFNPSTVQTKGELMAQKPPAFVNRPERAARSQAARPDFATPTFTVWTNYLTLSLAKGGQLWIYEVEGISDDATRPKKKVLMEKFIHSCTLLSAQRPHFTTDYSKRIVAYRDLSLHSISRSVDQRTATALAEIEVENFNARSQSSEEPLKLSLHFKKAVAFDPFNELCQPTRDGALGYDDDLTSAINLMISDALKEKSGNDVLTIVAKKGANKVYVKSGWSPLNERKVSIRGYSYGVHAGMGKPLLNVNPIVTTFHNAMTVANYIRGQHGLRNPEMEKDLTGARVWLTMERMKTTKTQPANLDKPSRRIKTIAGFGDVAERQIAYGTTTVWQHIKVIMGYDTKGSQHSICVNLGGAEGKAQWFLAEDLQILPYQPFRGDTSSLTKDIIKLACKRPPENVSLIIGEFVPLLGMNNSNDNSSCKLQEPGVELFPKLQEVPAHNAVGTKVEYADRSTVTKMGQWDLSNQKFLNTFKNFAGKAFFLIPAKAQRHWSFGNKPLRGDDLSRCITFFYEQYKANGVRGLDCGFRTLDNTNSLKISSFTVQDFARYIQKAWDSGADLVVLMLPTKNKNELKKYANFKAAADQVHGMNSLCLCEEKIINALKVNKKANLDAIPMSNDAQSPYSGYVRNVGMKLNVRLGNLNHSAQQHALQAQIPKFDDKNVMILGADVVHPDQGAHIGTPSIAAVVGTIDKHLAMFRGSARRQQSRVEIISDMQSMVEQRLRAYREVNKCLPSRILYYRDGIDEGQFGLVQSVETEAIRSAHQALARNTFARVRVTTIVVSKRHSTRFYPKDKLVISPKNTNCHPGTVVDSGVCMPYNYDFFLLSHNAIQGTARPAHYIILQDEIGFQPAQIQNLTNMLCYTYARSTTAVSYVPAAYYADHLCERVKQYLRPLFDKEDLGDMTVDEKSDELWNRAQRKDQSGNPWSEHLDNTMFWI